MAGAEHSGSDAAGHQRGQLQQAQRVGDLRAGASDAPRQLVMGAPEVLQQLLVGGRLLERVQLAAVQVLQQGVAQEGVVLGLLDDRRDGLEAGLLGGAPATLTHDELKADLAVAVALGLHRNGPHHDGLQHADLADAVHELAHVVLIEDAAGLLGVRADRRDGDLGIRGPGHGRQAVLSGGALCVRCGGRLRGVSPGVGHCRGLLVGGLGRRGGGLDGSAAENRRASGGSRAVAPRTRLLTSAVVLEEDVDRTGSAIPGGTVGDQGAEPSTECATLLAHLVASLVAYGGRAWGRAGGRVCRIGRCWCGHSAAPRSASSLAASR